MASTRVSGWWFAFDRLAELELPAALKGANEEQIKNGLKEAGKRLNLKFSLEESPAESATRRLAMCTIGMTVSQDMIPPQITRRERISLIRAAWIWTRTMLRSSSASPGT